MDFTYGFPLVDIAQVDAGLDHLIEGAAELHQGRFNAIKDHAGLRSRFSRMERLAVRSRRRRAGDENEIAGAHRPRITDDVAPYIFRRHRSAHSRLPAR